MNLHKLKMNHNLDSWYANANMTLYLKLEIIGLPIKTSTYEGRFTLAASAYTFQFVDMSCLLGNVDFDIQYVHIK